MPANQEKEPSGYHHQVRLFSTFQAFVNVLHQYPSLIRESGTLVTKGSADTITAAVTETRALLVLFLKASRILSFNITDPILSEGDTPRANLGVPPPSSED